MTNDLISRQAAIDAVHKEFDDCLVWDESGEYTADEVERILDRVPSAQPQQICEYWDSESKFCALCRPSAQPQPRTGKWIHIRTEEDGNALYECSECHMGEVHVPIVEVKYCWNCGAKMEVEE